ncbi:hypothetical protein K438DRAFT_1980776 [Mycena galopus ATCC 62051]|nr:hypothetical protein K438DRAFT_1980776 [Mycena galopus ATCC 62051]
MLGSRYYPGPAKDTDTSSMKGQHSALSSKERGANDSQHRQGPFWIPTTISNLQPVRSRRIPSCVFRTTHMKLTASISTLQPRSPPKFHSPDIPLDAEALHGAA